MSTYMLLFLNHLFLLLLSAKCDGYFRSKDACLPFNCGEFTNVQYPFHEFSSPECGPRHFELLCTEKNGVSLLIENRSFKVKSISLSEQLVLVADSQLIDVVANKRYCNLPAPINESELGFFHPSHYNGYVEFMFCFPWFIGGSATLATCGGNYLIHRYMISVRLLGFCSEGRKRALVYEFMPNGSLDKVISAMGNGVHVLSWEQIYHIALGIARGIWYLHRGCNVRIMHFDIKPHNILLDDSFNPKISDFGLAKLCPKSNITSMVARGTLGYIAPELFSRIFGVISCKTDIYSYGVLTLEAVGKMKLGGMEGENPSPMYIPVWVYDQLSQGRILETGEMTADDEKILKKMAIVGFWCIQLNPAHRPCINMVIQMLEGDVETLQMPPRPFPSPGEREHMLFCSEITNKNELPNNWNSTDK
ncbi:hypothetical protein AAC387_Pa04g2831 [Persea americana]